MSVENITIVDYGMGNLGSIKNMLKHLGIASVITADSNKIMSAEKLILPGVGAFDNGIKILTERGLIDALNKKVLEEKTPILGICLGMQMFTNKSEEGQLSGLGWIDAEISRFKFNGNDNKLKVPHMGWNLMEQSKESKLLDGMYNEPRFYFVHSFHLTCTDENDCLGFTDYGYRFVSAVEKNNIYGVQFHPEKSHKFGMKILNNFSKFV